MTNQNLTNQASQTSPLEQIIIQCIKDTHQVSPIESGLLLCQHDESELQAALLKSQAGHWQTRSFDEFSRMTFTTQYDLAIIDVRHLAHFAQALTRLRDLFAKRVLAAADTAQAKDMRSFGFEQLAQLDAHELKDNKLDGMSLWQFNILTYKQVPDWLNAKYWANPENWGKYRW